MNEQVAAIEALRPRVFGLIRHKLFDEPTELIEDLTQDVITRAFEKLPGFRGEASLETWVFTIATNVVIQYHRKHIPEFIEDFGSLAVHQSNALDELIREEERQAMRDAIKALPDKYKDVIHLHHFRGMKTKEVANQLGISHSNVKVRLHRAYIKLKKALK